MAGAVPLIVAGCQSVLGIGDFTFDRSDGAGGQGGAGGATETGSATADSTTGTTTSGGGGDGGSGGSCDSCGGDTLVSKVLQASGGTALSALAVDVDGNVFVAGSYTGTLNLGGGIVLTNPSGNGFVAKLDAEGNALWAQGFTGAMVDNIAIASAPKGNVVVAGTFEPLTARSLILGGFRLGGQSAVNGFVLDLDSATGAVVWGVASAGGDAAIVDVAADSDGNIFAAGDYSGAVTWGGAPLPELGANAYVIKLLSDGSYGWGNGIFGDGSVKSIAVDFAGSVHVQGTFTGTVDLGSGSVRTAGNLDAFLGVFDAAGNDVFLRPIGGMGNDSIADIAVTRSAVTWFAGQTDGTFNYGGGSFTSLDELDAFIVAVESNGETVFGHLCSGKKAQTAASIAVDAGGGAVMVGDFAESIDLGGEDVAARGVRDGFVASYGNDSARRWTRSFGGVGAAVTVTSVAVDASGPVWAAGYFQGDVDFGGGAGSVSDTDQNRAFLVKLSP